MLGNAQKTQENALRHLHPPLTGERRCKSFTGITARHLRGWQILDERFDDAGKSSETLERPALERLLQKIEAERIDYVVVYSFDRLTRKLFDLHRLLDRFERHGVVLSVVTDPHFGETTAGRLMSNIVAAASEFQQEMTRERIAEARSTS